jgi:hypothetical protein
MTATTDTVTTTPVEAAAAAVREAIDALLATQGGSWVGGVTTYQELRRRAGLPALRGDENWMAAHATYKDLKKRGLAMAPADPYAWGEGGEGGVTPDISRWIGDAVYYGEIRPLRKASQDDPCGADRLVTARDAEGRLWYGVSRGNSTYQSSHSPRVVPVGWTT